MFSSWISSLFNSEFEIVFWSFAGKALVSVFMVHLPLFYPSPLHFRLVGHLYFYPVTTTKSAEQTYWCHSVCGSSFVTSSAKFRSKAPIVVSCCGFCSQHHLDQLFPPLVMPCMAAPLSAQVFSHLWFQWCLGFGRHQLCKLCGSQDCQWHPVPCYCAALDSFLEACGILFYFILFFLPEPANS